MKYKISLHGCDDSTVFEMELTEEEYKLLKKIADKSEEVSTWEVLAWKNF
ncbi:hypothetical protein [Caloranaerobacter sp. DY30410]